MPPEAQLSCRQLDDGVEFGVLVSPGSSRSCVRGLHGGVLKIAVRAPPEKGKANAEVEEVIAAALGLPRRAVRVTAGQTSRRKRVQVLGISAGELLARLRL
jgi:hypothetical protein